ncbi:MAG: hypothetical protein JWR85_2457 [Marmoricola sp.]|nr:hypothetical protein [Marmoricola sp.]
MAELRSGSRTTTRSTTALTVQEAYPLERTAEALAAFARGTIGKVLITTD